MIWQIGAFWDPWKEIFFIAYMQPQKIFMLIGLFP